MQRLPQSWRSSQFGWDGSPSSGNALLPKEELGGTLTNLFPIAYWSLCRESSKVAVSWKTQVTVVSVVQAAFPSGWSREASDYLLRTKYMLRTPAKVQNEISKTKKIYVLLFMLFLLIPMFIAAVQSFILCQSSYCKDLQSIFPMSGQFHLQSFLCLVAGNSFLKHGCYRVNLSWCQFLPFSLSNPALHIPIPRLQKGLWKNL